MPKIYFVTEDQAKAIKKLVKASRELYDDACDREENWDNEKGKEFADYHALGVAIRACRKADEIKVENVPLILRKDKP
jgi:hypothetical protein